MTIRRSIAAALLATGALLPLPAQAQTTLEEQFRDPPQSARPRVCWHWMDGNITRDGIAKDMVWMKAVGIGDDMAMRKATDVPMAAHLEACDRSGICDRREPAGG